MAISLGNNITSVGLNRRFREVDHKLNDTFARLSSGRRINRASDDSAGLAVAFSLTADSRIFTQAARNIGDAISALNIVSSAMDELSTIVTRIAEISEQSANGVYSSVQRQALNAEAQQLRLEFNRIIQTTKYNGRSLLSSDDSLYIQAGINSSASSILDVGATYALRRRVGDGTFGSATTYGGAVAVQDIVTGDFNNDGKIDVITHASSGHGLRISLGNGDGSFNSPSTIFNGAGQSLAIGDVNGDGNLDFVASNNSVLRLFLGNGNGTFGAFHVETSVNDATDLFLTDINGDDRLDLLVFRRGNSEYAAFLGNGNGTFLAKTSFALTNPFDYELADVDGDGRVEVIESQTTNSGNIYSIGANGALTQISSFTPGNTSSFLSVGDTNGDGILDIAAVTPGSSANIILGNSNGTYRAPMSLTPPLIGAARFTLSDLNDDGFDDAIIGNAGNFMVLLSNGNGTFQSARTFSHGGASLRGIAINDVTNDGVPDILITHDLGLTFSVNIQNSSVDYGLQQFNLLTRQDALATLDSMNSTLSTIALSQGKIGASLARLEIALRNAHSSRENALAAASRIQDADIAEETARMVRLQILQSVTASVQTQANLLPELALQLLN